MPKKSLTSALKSALARSSIEAEPPLASAYVAAVKIVCEVDWVRAKQWDYARFYARQKELDDAGIAYDDYAASVVKTWWGWCQIHGMSIVSAPLFCGPKAFARYKRDKERHPHVEIATLSEEVHQARVIEETLVAELFIGGYPYTSVEHIRNVLSTFHEYPPDPDIVAEVLDLMNRAYGFAVESYEQLAKQHRKRYNTRAKHYSS